MYGALQNTDETRVEPRAGHGKNLTQFDLRDYALLATTYLRRYQTAGPSHTSGRSSVAAVLAKDRD